MKKECKTCRWRDTDTGECHKNPPCVVGLITRDTFDRLITQTERQFPYVYETDYCGQHENVRGKK